MKTRDKVDPSMAETNSLRVYEQLSLAIGAGRPPDR